MILKLFGIALAFVAQTILPARAEQAAGGEAVFKRQCAACHTVDGGRMPVGGPTLKGIFGRKAAAAEGFRSYTAALRDSGIVWDAASLDAFLADPKGRVPGTSQPIAVRNEGERRAIVAYLESLR
jgi:cytochrome c